MVQRNSGWLHFGESLGGALERARGELYTLKELCHGISVFLVREAG